MSPFLSDEEISGICDGLVMPAAQRRYLASLGLIVKAKPNGRPLVARGEYERVLIGRRPDSAVQSGGGPNIVGFEQWAAQRKSRGQKSQGR